MEFVSNSSPSRMLGTHRTIHSDLTTSPCVGASLRNSSRHRDSSFLASSVEPTVSRREIDRVVLPLRLSWTKSTNEVEITREI